MKDAKSDALRRVPLFAGLSESEIKALAGRALPRQYKPGEVLFSEGDGCHGIFLLARGRVRIFKTAPSGRQIMLAIESAPSSVAEVPLFDGGPYPATVSAVEDVTAYLISQQDFRKFCLEHPEVALKVLALVGGRLRQLVSVVEAVTFGSVRQRLARTLLDFGLQAGSESFPLAESHQDLASRLGTVREVVSRNLSRFQAEGLIRLGKKQVRILDPVGLEREAVTEM